VNGIKLDFRYHLDNSRGQGAKEMPCIVSSITATNTSLLQSDITRFTSFLSAVCVLHQRNALSKTLQHGACSELAAAQRSLSDRGCLFQTRLTPDSSWWGRSECDGADQFGNAPFSHSRVTLLSAIQQLYTPKNKHTPRKSLC
jgi:hypothetical protein